MNKLIFLILSALLNAGITTAQLNPENKFLNFSDLHFDPFYDTTLVETLVQSDISEWENIFLNSDKAPLNSYGTDTDFSLFKSSMEEMSTRIPDPDFIIITGDFLGHNFKDEYEHFTGIYDLDSLYLFKKKTMQFITDQIVKYFPDTQIFPLAGNNDSYCGNYAIEPDGDFLKMITEIWDPLVNKDGNNPDFKEEFSKGGYCMLNFPGETNFKMIILNTIFFSTNYKNRCGDSLQDPGAEELAWLKNTLQQCKENGHKVWMSYHIPPGIDIYGTINGKGDCEQKIFPAMKKDFNEEFFRTIVKYSGIINSAFAGHFHRDDFRIIYDRDNPVSYIHITPSISPIYSTNPSYQIMEYDKSDFTLKNYQTYYLKNFSEPGTDEWTFEYDFRESYDEASVTALSMKNISDKIYSDTTYRNRYIEFYTSLNYEMTVKDIPNWRYNWCGLGNLTVEEYAGCMCKDSR